MSTATIHNILHKIINSMKPIHVICKFLGLNNIRITANGVLNQNKKFQYFYITFYIVLYTLLIIYSLFLVITKDNISILLNKYLVCAEYCAITHLMLIVVIFNFLFRKVQVRALELLAHIDVSFAKNGVHFEYHNLLRMNYIILGGVSASLVLRSFLIFLTFRGEIIQQFTLVIAIATKTFSTYQFVVFVLQLRLRYTKINELIRTFYDTNSKLTTFILSPNLKQIPDRLHTFCRLHYKLSSVMQRINFAFAVQLLLSIAVSLFDVLYQSYYLYFVATGKAKIFSTILILNPIVWLLDETVEIYCLVHACATTCDQANEIPTYLHELRNRFFDLNIENHIQTYSLQMLHQKVQFSVLGFFVIDYTLIYSIVGAVTTYLVIFIQFDQSSSAYIPSYNSSDDFN